MVITKQLRQQNITFTISRLWNKLARRIRQDINCLTQNPWFFIMRKTARFEVFRTLASALQQPAARSYQVTTPTFFENLDAAQVAAKIQQEGYCTGLQLPPPVVQSILDYAATHPCWGDRQPRFEFDLAKKAEAEAAFSRTFRLASYPGEPDVAIDQVVNDPSLLAIAAQYFGTDPVLVGSELLWSFPVPGTSIERLKTAQVLHYDVDDYCCLKFFFYLTEVDETSGPHACIPRSHRGKKLFHQILGQRCAIIEDEKLIAAYGRPLVTFCGQPGFGFVEDPFCFHRGNPVEQTPRLMLQVEYAAHNYGNIRSYYELESSRIVAPS